MSSESDIVRRAAAEFDRAVDSVLRTGTAQLVPPVGPPITFRAIFRSEMDALTEDLESQGYRIWFTTEVDGVEYRLAAPKQ